MEKLVWASVGVTHMAGCSSSLGLHRGTQERGPSPCQEAGRPAAEGRAPSDTSRERTENGVGVGGRSGTARAFEDTLMGPWGRLWAPDVSPHISEQW